WLPAPPMSAVAWPRFGRTLGLLDRSDALVLGNVGGGGGGAVGFAGAVGRGGGGAVGLGRAIRLAGGLGSSLCLAGCLLVLPMREALGERGGVAGGCSALDLEVTLHLLELGRRDGLGLRLGQAARTARALDDGLDVAA